MKIQNKTQIYNQNQNKTKRKLDYHDLPLNNTEEIDEEKDLNLTPHILEESRLIQSDTSHINTSPNKSEDTNYINITHHHREASPSPSKTYYSCTEETPKAIISIERNPQNRSPSKPFSLPFPESISDPETLSFLRSHFPASSSEILMEDFIDYLISEYSSSVPSHLELPLVKFLVDKLKRDDEYVSLPRLEIFTKDIGLSNYVDN